MYTGKKSVKQTIKMTDRQIYLCIIWALVAALAGVLFLVFRNNELAKNDSWYGPIIGIMILVSIQHMNGK